MRGDGAGDGVEVEREIAHRGLNQFAATGTNSDGEECEGTFAGDAFQTGPQQNAGGKIDDFAGTEPNEYFLGANTETFSKNFAEAFAAAVGIPVGFAKSAASGLHSFGRRPQRIFVGGEFDGVDLKILLDFFDGFAGNVGRKALDVIGNEFFESVGHGRRRFRRTEKLMERISLNLLCTIRMKNEVTGGGSVRGRQRKTRVRIG